MLGQYFTENTDLQKQVYSLRKNSGTVLEPSSGRGHLVKFFEGKGVTNITTVEIDGTLGTISHTKPLNMDFFDYSLDNCYDSIVGNPPFVKQNEMLRETKLKAEKNSLLKNCNLFYYFVEKSFYHLNKNGEIIFIIPREFLNSTRASVLRKLLYKNGTITDIIDYEEGRFFKGAAPNIIIIRYEKDNHSHVTNYIKNNKCVVKNESLYNDAFLYTVEKPLLYTLRLGNVFDVKVGLVTGLNSVFERDSKFSIPTICSDYKKTKKKRNFIFVDEVSMSQVKIKDPELYKYLLENKSKLLSRNIKKFTDVDWMHYGAVRNLSFMRKRDRCIYVNTKTRDKNPFFVDDVGYFDGSVLGLFMKNQLDFLAMSLARLDLTGWCDILNNKVEDFREQGMYVNNRFLLTVKSLSDFQVNIYYDKVNY